MSPTILFKPRSSTNCHSINLRYETNNRYDLVMKNITTSSKNKDNFDKDSRKKS